MIDLDRPVPTLPLCVAGHVACVQAFEPGDDRPWCCWGWHLTAYDDEWQQLVADESHMRSAVGQLVAMIVMHEADHTQLIYSGRGL